MNDNFFKLVMFFQKWLYAGKPWIWVKGSEDSKWFRVNPNNIIWDENLQYSLTKPEPATVKSDIKPLYRRTMLYTHYNGNVYCKTVETFDTKTYQPNIHLPGIYTFLKWVDQWS